MTRIQANLGLASTRELLNELNARGIVSSTIGEDQQQADRLVDYTDLLLKTLPSSLLDYRTVESV